MPDKILKNVFAARAYQLLKQPEQARLCFENARVELEKAIRIKNDDPYTHGSLALVYAGTGEKNKAIDEAKLAIKIMPISQEAFEGPAHVLNLAEVYVMLGQYDLALTQIEYLLSIQSGFWISINYLRSDPVWDPLRSHPRYQKLLEKYKQEKF